MRTAHAIVIGTLLSSVQAVDASVVGSTFSVDVVAGTHTDNPPLFTPISTLSLYNPTVHTFGSTSILTPTSDQVAAARITSSEATSAGIRTLSVRIESVSSGAFANTELFDTLGPAAVSSLSFLVVPTIFGFDDPDRVGQTISTFTLFDITGAVLTTFTFAPINNAPSFGFRFFSSDFHNPFGNDFFGGTPVAYERTVSYAVVPSPSPVLFTVVAMAMFARPRRSKDLL